MDEKKLCRRLLETEKNVPKNAETLAPLNNYASLARKLTWNQKWDAKERTLRENTAKHTGLVWSDAIERALAENNGVYISKMAEPIYLDRPIVARSGTRLVVHPETEIRLIVKNDSQCLLRNKNIVSGQKNPVELCHGADTDILIEGGIWSDQKNEGRGPSGTCDSNDLMFGAHGAFVLHNSSKVTVRNVQFRDCSSFAIQVGNVSDFLIENIYLHDTADGVHVEGPATRGIIRNIKGSQTSDDIVALNAWDWDASSITFGTISDILVENVEVDSGHLAIRLLPGAKAFPDKEKIYCDILRCVFRNIRGCHTYKLYDQPNLAKPEEDFSDPIGKMSDLFFSDIVINGLDLSKHYDKSKDAVFEICANIENISIQNIYLNYQPGKHNMPEYLVTVGPKSLTWPKDKNGGWKEVFNPDAHPIVRELVIGNLYLPDAQKSGSYVRCQDIKPLVKERKLQLNPDFPNTMPKGGTGKGRIIELKVQS